MYRCTECNTEYEVRPEFCDCGNDTFEEIVSEERYYEPEQSYSRHSSRSKRMSGDEDDEYTARIKDKQKALITVGVSVLLSVLILVVFPPHMKKKANVVKQKAAVENVKIPDVSTYWDNTVPSPFRKKDPNANLPILNKQFRTISPVLRDYLVTIGAEFSRRWDPNLVDGSGECKVEFTINKEGELHTKKISVRSNNESLDDSVLFVLSKLNNFDVPPDDYKGERIIIGFKVDKNKGSKVYFPTK